MTGLGGARLHMPAEWEPHQCCWMAWPCRPESWPNGLGPARRAFGVVARAIARFEPVRLLTRTEDLAEARDLTQGVVDLVEAELDDSWARDIGPIFLRDDAGGLIGVDWGFNGWGLVHRNFARDARAARKILDTAGIGRLIGPQILEGGSIHVDGDGTLLTTEECLLDPERNPHLSKQDIEGHLKTYFGVETVIWLPRGIAYDETRGHVDNLCCFSAPGHVLIASTQDRARSRIAPSWPRRGRSSRRPRMRAGGAFASRRLPSPPRRLDGSGRPMALSYVNFYIANGAVIMPGFDSATDARRLGHPG